MFGRLRKIMRAISRDPEVRELMRELGAEITSAAIDALSRSEPPPAEPPPAGPQTGTPHQQQSPPLQRR